MEECLMADKMKDKNSKSCLCFSLVNPFLIKNQSMIVLAIILILHVQILEAKTQYFMDRKIDCSLQGFIQVRDNERLTVTLRNPTPTNDFDPQLCQLRFQTQNQRAFIKVEFQNFYIGSCTVTLLVNDNSYTCGGARSPTTKLLESRQMTLDLRRDIGDNQYGANIIVSAYLKDNSDQYQDEVSNPTLIGIIIGVVCGIIFVILLIALIGHCYFKALQKKRCNTFDGDAAMDDCDQSSIGIGYVNEGIKNGGIIKNSNSPKHKDRSLLTPENEVKQFHDFIDEHKKQPIGSNINIITNNSNNKIPAFNNEQTTKTDSFDSNSAPKSPILNALHNSPKFKTSFKLTEAEAEERAKRFSQGSTGPPTPPPLPKVPTSPHLQSSQTNPLHAGIRRAPKISASSEDMEHLEREVNTAEDHLGKRQGPPSNSVLSAKKEPQPFSAPLTTQPQLYSSVDPTVTDQPAPGQHFKDNGNNQHTLRPSRPQDKKKPGDIADGQPSKPPKMPKEKDSGINSLRKRGHKSPKSSKSKPFFSDGENNFMNDDSTNYSDTPASEASSRMTRADDQESLPPLQRTASRQSLFASRTSLYGRRGKRDRRPSITDSVTSYAHDDLDMYTQPDQHDPMDRRDTRVFKSMGDITKSHKDNPHPGAHRKYPSKRHKKPTTRKSTSSTQTIEQKGTQTEKKNPSDKERGVRDHPSSHFIKPAYSQPEDNVVPPPVDMTQSQFKPISNVSDVEASILPNDQYPVTGDDVAMAKASKSPWELLCELTNTEMQMRDDSNPVYKSDYAPSIGEQSRPSFDNSHSGYYPSKFSEREAYTSDYPPSTATISYPPSVASNAPGSNLYPRKSSWEALKELTDVPLSYPSKGNTESIV